MVIEVVENIKVILFFLVVGFFRSIRFRKWREFIVFRLCVEGVIIFF